MYSTCACGRARVCMYVCMRACVCICARFHRQAITKNVSNSGNLLLSEDLQVDGVITPQLMSASLLKERKKHLSCSKINVKMWLESERLDARATGL